MRSAWQSLNVAFLNCPGKNKIYTTTKTRIDRSSKEKYRQTPWMAWQAEVGGGNTYLQQSSPQACPAFSSGNGQHIKDVGKYVVLIYPCSLLSPSGTQDLNTAKTRELHGSSLWFHSHPRPLLIYIHSEIGRTLKNKKLVRENKISYINAYICNLDKWYRWHYLQNRNRDTNTANKCMDTKGGIGVGWTGRLGLPYTHYVWNR